MGLNKRIFTDLREFENEVIEGEINPLESWSELLELEKLIKKTKDNIKDTVIIEIEKQDKEYTRNGKSFLISKKATYDYTNSSFYSKLLDKMNMYESFSKAKYLGSNTIKNEEGKDIKIPKHVELPSVKYSDKFITVK
jgi:hypothetical protein